MHAGTLRGHRRAMLYHVTLDAIPLFAAATPARRALLARRAQVRKVAAREVVAVFGTPARHLVVVESGALTAYRENRDGRRLRLGDHPAPCAVDKAAVLGRRGHSATWVTARPSRLLWIPAAELLALIDDEPGVRRHVVTALAGQLLDREEALLRAAYDDTTTRVAAWLADQDRRDVRLPGGQAGLAETLGASRVSVNRALRALARAGAVTTRPGAVVILAPDRLRGYPG
jgi:CRP/FNR family transcriptional regulator, cyclic AMP receptor protein